MRLAGVLGVLMFLATPAMAGPVTYTFDADGTIGIESSIGSTSTSMGGTFAVTIYQNDCHVGESDTVVIRDASLANTADLHLIMEDVATAALQPGSARFLDFSQGSEGHIGPGGNAPILTDVYVEVTAILTGVFQTTFSTKTWAGTQLGFGLSFSTSSMRSDVLTAALHGQFGYVIGVPEFGLTVTLDMIVDVVGTAHVVPDPAFGGLTALSISGACAWLRLRRGRRS